MLTSDLKLSLIRQIADLPENLLLEWQATLNDLLTKSKRQTSNSKQLTYEQRLKELYQLASQIPDREDWDSYFEAFEESRKDRPLPFRED